MPKSFAMEVIADSSGNWAGNSCRYATEDEAKDAGAELFSRWTAVREWRVVPSEDEVNYVFFNGRSVSIESMKALAEADDAFFDDICAGIETEKGFEPR
jgi:hypothetical protein